MNRICFLACIISGLAVGSANAEDYLLRLDTIGYIDQPADETDPKEKTLRSMEVIARPNSPFHVKAQSGKETVTCSGKFEPSDHGKFRIAIRYRYSLEDTVLTDRNEVKPALYKRAFQTTIESLVGEPYITSELHSTSTKAGKPLLKSKIRHVLTLSHYEPSAE